MPRSLLKTYSPNLYYFGLIILVSGLPLSKFMMSISQMLIGLAWLMQGDYKERIFSFTKNKIALLLTSIYFIHLLGMLYTNDIPFGLEDVRKKIPLFVLPFLFSTMPSLTKKQIENILLLFVCAVLLSTLISLSIYLGIYKKPYLDIRDISIFISHIRLSLLICLSICILFLRINTGIPLWQKLFSVGIIIWFIVFLGLIEALTGLGILFLLFIFFLIRQIIKTKNNQLKVALFFSLLISLGSIIVYTRTVYLDFIPKEHFSPSSIQKTTAMGNAYRHDFSSGALENGYYVNLFICDKELDEEWKKKSTHDIKGKNHTSEALRETLIRFLTSKGLKKDAEGIKQLSAIEVKAIENGIANVYYLDKNSLRTRFHKIFWELWSYQKGGNPSGNSLTMRFEFWKTSWAIIMEQPYTGVGTGDTKSAFQEKYKEMNSMLDEKYRLRSHNQFLSIGIAFGIPVMFYFIFSLVYPMFRYRKNILYLGFSLIAILSMLTEDTLETQAGVTFYAFFNAFLLLSAKKTDFIPT